MTNLKRLYELTKQCGEYNAALIAVSKTHPPEAVGQAYNAGQRLFGENKVQELVEKAEVLKKDIQWHMIGHLQRNKVKYIAPFVSVIHSVDSLRLAREIDHQAEKADRHIRILLQVHIASETSKFGFDEKELLSLLNEGAFDAFRHLEIGGLMGMATFTGDRHQIRREFRHLRFLFEQIREQFFHEEDGFRDISMGMSGDYDIALEEGSTLIRIGSAIFGHRGN